MPKRLPPLTETCRRCDGPLARNGHNKAGSAMAKCKDCGLVQVLEPKPMGRPPVGDRAMTPAERSRRHRRKQ